MNIMEGIKIIDVTTWAFVPSAGCVLAQWGADVIKVENPNAPDPMRMLGGTLEPGKASLLFKHYNRGKRGIAVDLGSAEGRDVLYRLVEDADVFLTSYLPAVRQKLEIDVEHIRAHNPDIVYAKGTGHGPRGPEAERGGYDGATWWCRGSLVDALMEVSGAERPTGMVGHGDGMSGMTLAGGISAALLHRERTGHAPVVDASLLGTAIWFNGPAINSAADPNLQRFGARIPRDMQPAGMNDYATKDDRFIRLLLLGDHDPLWRDLFAHLDRAELAEDLRFADSQARSANNRELMAILDDVFAQKTLEQWKARLVTTKAVWAPIQTAAEIHSDPQTLANRFVSAVDYPDGPVPLVAPPILFDEDPGEPGKAPDFCQHTDEVLGAAGYTAEAIAKLRSDGTVA